MIMGIFGRVMLVMAVFLCLPLIVGAIYKEDLYFAFLIPAGSLALLGVILIAAGKTKSGNIYATEGFIIVALSWIIMSVVGALPFVLSGEIPNFFDALFESVSGFTTTGATILPEVEVLSHATQFWRVFTHWLGGMGVLVFLLAIIPRGAGMMHIFRAESTGPSSSKLVSKMSYTARILYGIYIFLTLLETLFLVCGGASFYEALLTAFSTAGTGGFSMYTDSIAHFNSAYIEIVVAVFMLLFGVNFNVYYLILVGQFKKVLKNEELRVYLIILITATVVIAVNILSTSINFITALRYSFFQVTSISSTTGFVSYDFKDWPALSKGILLFLTVIGACGGSTGGGIKVARLTILLKSGAKDIKKLLHPRTAESVRFEGEPIEKQIERNVRTYAIIWVLLVVVSTLVLSIFYNDLYTNFLSSLSCIGNVGPLVSEPMFCFNAYNSVSKVVLSILMLAGRLEIFPIIILLTPYAWRK